MANFADTMSYSIRIAVPLVLDSLFQMPGAVSLAISPRYCELNFKLSDTKSSQSGQIVNLANKTLKNEVREFINGLLQSELLFAGDEKSFFELSLEIKNDTGKFSENEKAIIIAGIICGINYFYKKGNSRQDNIDIAIQLFNEMEAAFNLSVALAAINGGMVSLFDIQKGNYLKTSIPNGIFLNIAELNERVLTAENYSKEFCLAWSGFNTAMFISDFNMIRECLTQMNRALCKGIIPIALIEALKSIDGYLGYTTATNDHLVIFTDNTLAMERSAELLRKHLHQPTTQTDVLSAHPDKEGIIKI